MKRIVTIITVLSVLLVSYGIWEVWYVNRFVSLADEKLTAAICAESAEQMQQIGQEMQEHFRARRILFREVISQTDMENISTALARFNNYAAEGDLTEARAEAVEVRQYLSYITGVFTT